VQLPKCGRIACRSWRPRTFISVLNRAMTGIYDLDFHVEPPLALPILR
jgi:hypothetical protein